MAKGIKEIWRRDRGLNLPVQFTVAQPPQVLTKNTDGEVVLTPLEGLIVSDISFRELGSIGGTRMNRGVFVVSFEDAPLQRMIPEDEVVDIAYEPKE